MLFSNETKESLLSKLELENEKQKLIRRAKNSKARQKAIYGSDKEIAATFGASFKFCGGQKKKKDRMKWDARTRLVPTAEAAEVYPANTVSNYGKKPDRTFEELLADMQKPVQLKAWK